MHAKFGTPTGTSTLDGLPLTIAVYDDPTDDSLPGDAVLVRQIAVPGGVSGGNTGAWQTYDLAALSGSVVPATGGMWVGVGVTYPAGTSPGPGSIEFFNNDAPGTQWLVTNGSNAVNYAGISGNTSVVDLQTGPGFPPGTWVIKVESGADYRQFGAGCAGSNGIPSIDGDPFVSPSPGLAILFQVANLPVPPTLTGLLLSFSRNDPAIDLGTFAGVGSIGCGMHVPPFSFRVLTSAAGLAGYGISLPPDPTLAGISLFAQALAVDPGANALNITTSNGVQAVIGF